MRKRATPKSTWIASRLLATILAVMGPALAHAQTQTVTASWDANTDQYTSGYRLYWGTSPTALTNSADAGNATSHRVTLAIGTTYYFVVRGYTAGGTEGPASNQTQITLPATAPGAPVNMRADVSGLTVTLSWSPDPTGGAPGAYLVSVGLSPGASNVAASQPVGNVTSVSASLPRGVFYARVKAQNSLGISADSAEVAFTIGGKKPPQPGALTGWLQNGVATLSWSAHAVEDGASSSGYHIEVGSGPGLANLASVPVGNVTSFQVGSVPPGVYYVRVRTMNDVGLGDPSNEIVLRSATVGAPQALTESGQDNMVQLNWRAPLTGDIPAGYVIEAGSGPGLVDIATHRLGNALTFATTAPPGMYYVRIRAVGTDGVAGEASNEVVIRR